LPATDHQAIDRVIAKYGPIPSLNGIRAEALAARLGADKKTIQGKIHFVLPSRIGEVRILSGIDDRVVLESIEAALA
jgi:3-dehydroquinate synthase